jgi:DNA-directed RNA polymerase specialized sigma24 family protein
MELMLRNLPAHQREIIVATYLRRRTTREAATLLGVTPEAVKARLYQAMRHLSAMVATDWPDDADSNPAASPDRAGPATVSGRGFA